MQGAYNVATSNQACQTPMTGEAPPVTGALNNVSFEQDVTSSLIGDLMQRLDAVLRPLPPSEQKKDSLGRMAHSEMHNRVNDLISRQEGINSALRSLLERVTV